MDVKEIQNLLEEIAQAMNCNKTSEDIARGIIIGHLVIRLIQNKELEKKATSCQ